ncbi:MAG: hypothetical protein IANPNBLG_01212 [Bryobacteraceae bacterium]|nr:hypothetical protein [Bryobacteraceae bacterium]
MLGLWVILALCGCCAAAVNKPDPRPDPKAISVHPFTVQRGTAKTVIVRGSGLQGTNGVFAGAAPFHIVIEGVEPEPKDEGGHKGPVDLVRMRVEVAADANPGRYPFRLITSHGVSNAITLFVSELPVTAEPEGSHDSPDMAVPVSPGPVLFAGRLSHRGEADFYRFKAKAGETLTFQVISGLPQIAAGGSGATVPNFDPSLTIYEAGTSWFDPSRLKRIAYNDEPAWVVGKPTDAYLVHRFQQAGDYLLRVEAFAGQGGPDYSYQLKVVPGEKPEDLPPVSRATDDRAFTRILGADRLNELASRGGDAAQHPSVETYRAAAAPADAAPLFKLPGTIVGTIERPGEIQRARFQLDGPRDIAIEVETPAAAPPYFNPVVRMLNTAGEEVATNVFAGKGACSGALTKSLQAKTIVPVREAGTYTIEVRDVTADFGGPDFRYRVQVRPAIPHAGRIVMSADHVNLARGEATSLRVVFDREEGYLGGIAVSAEALPPGVQALAGADFEAEKDPPSFAGKRERYEPRTERAVVVLSAAKDAAPTPRPQVIRLVARPVSRGKLGPVLATKSIPLMVIPGQ